MQSSYYAHQYIVYAGTTKLLLWRRLLTFCKLFYKDGRLRVVVSTANLVEYDWRDIENVSFRSVFDTHAY